MGEVAPADLSQEGEGFGFRNISPIGRRTRGMPDLPRLSVRRRSRLNQRMTGRWLSMSLFATA
jgi:hypothetical protein